MVNVIRKVTGSLSYLAGETLYQLQKRQNVRTIRSYQNKYCNESCFIIGNGPSLRPEDLTILANNHIITFAANRIYNIYSRTDWRPDFISISDDGLSMDKKHINNMNFSYTQICFARNQFTWRLRKLKSPKCFLKTDYRRSLLETPSFSSEPDRLIYDIATVTYYNLQLAAYMGFKTIFLLGCDSSYTLNRQADGTIIKSSENADYFHDISVLQTSPVLAATYEMDIAYNYAQQHSKAHGLCIFNATRGGKLNGFQRVTFEKAINDIRSQKTTNSIC